MQDLQEFYRCLVSDAAGRALLRIRDILADETLDDEACFYKIEAIVNLLEDLGISAVGTHRFCAEKSLIPETGNAPLKRDNEIQGEMPFWKGTSP